MITKDAAGTSVRDILTKTMESDEKKTTPPADEVIEDTADVDDTDDTSTDLPGTGDDTPADGAEDTAGAPEPGTGDAAATQVAQAPAAPSEGDAKPPVQGDDLKAPGTWTPEAREHWKTIPIQAREQIIKRDKEASRALTMSTESRKFQEEFQRVINPYMGFIAAEGAQPLAAVNSVMQSAALLRVGTPQQKVAVAAGIIKNFGIDLVMLDQMLAGEQMQSNNPQVMLQQIVQQEMAPFRQIIQQQQTQHQTMTQEINSQVDLELDDFAKKNEFYHDVKGMMADLMEVAQRNGQALSLTDAYARATLLSEPVRRVIEGRKATSTARQSQQIASKARNAAVSVRSSDNIQSGTPAPGNSLRDALNFAFDNTKT